MTYMLDTNVCVDAIRQGRGPRLERVSEAFHRRLPEGLTISSITLAELEFGVVHSSNPPKNRLALMGFLSVMTVLPFDALAAVVFAQVREDLQRRGAMIDPYDLLIGCHAKSLDHTLVTNNTREFERIDGLRVEDWAV